MQTLNHDCDARESILSADKYIRIGGGINYWRSLPEYSGRFEIVYFPGM